MLLDLSELSDLFDVVPEFDVEEAMALEMRDTCERCAVSLTADGPASLCSYECTFCPDCAEAMAATCPNCGGELVPRPRRRA